MQKCREIQNNHINNVIRIIQDHHIEQGILQVRKMCFQVRKKEVEVAIWSQSPAEVKYMVMVSQHSCPLDLKLIQGL